MTLIDDELTTTNSNHTEINIIIMNPLGTLPRLGLS